MANTSYNVTGLRILPSPRKPLHNMPSTYRQDVNAKHSLSDDGSPPLAFCRLGRTFTSPSTHLPALVLSAETQLDHLSRLRV